MYRRHLLAAATGLALAAPTAAQTANDESQASFDTVMAFMGAMGKGDMDSMGRLIADDMVWQNEGDPALPWIGIWEGKETILGSSAHSRRMCRSPIGKIRMLLPPLILWLCLVG